MVREKYGVRLTAEQRNQFQHLVRAGKGTARVTVRARILLKTDEGWRSDLSPKRGWKGCPKSVPEASDRGEAHLIALAAPNRRKGMNWTLAFWRARWWSWGWRPPYPTRRCGCT